MFVDILNEIENVQRNNISIISLNKRGNTSINVPPKKCSGLYFLYTSFTDDELTNCGVKPLERAVPIAELANQNKGLNNSYQRDTDGFRLVYNGIGGFKGGAYDLRARILQEISTTDHRTGSLCIRQTMLDDLSKWRFSYFILPQQSLSQVDAHCSDDWNFETYGEKLEFLWRLHFGWPILCRK